jgi:predicted dehydrogenase
MEKKINFAVIGSGHIGKRHAEMIRRNPEANLVAMVDIKKQEDCGFEANDFQYFNSIEKLIEANLDIDVVNICSPNGLHASQSISALTAGKHVVCEKPMGLTKDNCEQVIFKALQMSKNVFCVMQNRYSPPSEWIKDVVSTGKLGDMERN